MGEGEVFAVAPAQGEQMGRTDGGFWAGVGGERRGSLPGQAQIEGAWLQRKGGGSAGCYSTHPQQHFLFKPSRKAEYGLFCIYYY